MSLSNLDNTLDNGWIARASRLLQSVGIKDPRTKRYFWEADAFYGGKVGSANEVREVLGDLKKSARQHALAKDARQLVLIQKSRADPSADLKQGRVATKTELSLCVEAERTWGGVIVGIFGAISGMLVTCLGLICCCCICSGVILTQAAGQA